MDDSNQVTKYNINKLIGDVVIGNVSDTVSLKCLCFTKNVFASNKNV